MERGARDNLPDIEGDYEGRDILKTRGPILYSKNPDEIIILRMEPCRMEPYKLFIDGVEVKW